MTHVSAQGSAPGNSRSSWKSSILSSPLKKTFPPSQSMRFRLESASRSDSTRFFAAFSTVSRSFLLSTTSMPHSESAMCCWSYIGVLDDSTKRK